jgi:hypothetical protein
MASNIQRYFRDENSDCNRKYSETETLMKTGEKKKRSWTERPKGVFGCGTRGDGMEWFHSDVMGWFRPCVRFRKNRGTEWFRFLFGSGITQ